MSKSKKRKNIGEYNLIEEIGAGGQGTVWRAFKGEAGEAVAVKILELSHPKQYARFLKEISTHAALTAAGATNVMPLLSHAIVERDDGGVEGYLVMPLAEVSLQKVIDTVRHRLELSLEIFSGITNGLKAAHAVGIVHRDVKPANVLFMDRSLREPLVSDFGIALLRETPDADRITEVGETVGAKFFMAPEQEHGGITDVTFAADVYGAAKVLHFMLTGRYLSRERLDVAFTDEELRREPRLTAVAEEILARCIIEDPAKRLQNATELHDATVRLLAGFRTQPGTNGGGNGGSLYRTYESYVNQFLSEPERSGLLFDALQDNFRAAWQQLHEEVKDDHANAPNAVQRLLRSQQSALAATLALARTDTDRLFQNYKRLLEFVTAQSEGVAGYVAIGAIPQVEAGFLYMSCSVEALFAESWAVFQKLLTERFRWTYQSARALYSYGFDHSYFFHSDALGNDGPKHNDLFRALLSEPTVVAATRIQPEELVSVYAQTDLLMCLRAAQLAEAGEDVSRWADFGRFYGERITPLLDRMYHERDFAAGVLRSFGESREQFFTRLNERLKFIVRNFFGSGRYLYASISEWHPR